MTQQEYEQKRKECWEEYFIHVVCGTGNYKYLFNKIFDQAYTLGKQEKDAEGEEMLIIPRRKVQELYAQLGADAIANREVGKESFAIFGEAQQVALFTLFGDKCLFDKK